VQKKKLKYLFAQMLKDLFTFEYRGLIPVKGKGKLKTYFLEKEGKATGAAK